MPACSRVGPMRASIGLNNPGDRYEFPNKVRYWQTIAPLLEKASPLRTAHLRDPLGPQNHFASESFMDEMAVAVSADPVDFRLRYLQEGRDADVLKGSAVLLHRRSHWRSPASRVASRARRHRRPVAPAC